MLFLNGDFELPRWAKAVGAFIAWCLALAAIVSFVVRGDIEPVKVSIESIEERVISNTTKIDENTKANRDSEHLYHELRTGQARIEENVDALKESNKRIEKTLDRLLDKN